MAYEVGGVLCGKYLLDALIGRGGMGEVFAATDLTAQRRVAIKVVQRTSTDPLLAARLRREAEAVARVRSRYVAEVYEVDATADGEVFLVMELLQGESAAQRLAAGQLTWDEVRGVGEDVLRGLEAAHAAGVVHRDLKPGNIFLESPVGGRSRAKILDFGVAKLDGHDGDQLTTTGEAVGTIAYMAPEQIRGASAVDERADLYAFAMVIFELLSGRLAYEAAGQIALLASKLEHRARPLRELARVPVPPGLDALLARCLSRRAQDRPGSARLVLEEWLALGPATVAPAGEEPSRRGRIVRVGLAVAALALLASSAAIVGALRARTTAARAVPRDDRVELAADASSPVVAGSSAPATSVTPPAAPSMVRTHRPRGTRPGHPGP